MNHPFTPPNTGNAALQPPPLMEAGYPHQQHQFHPDQLKAFQMPPPPPHPETPWPEQPQPPMLQVGIYSQPPQGTNLCPQAVQAVPPLPPVRQAAVRSCTPFPALTEIGTELMTIESIALRDLRLASLHCHRETISQHRIDQLAERIRALVQLPPLHGWRAPDGNVVLADGFHRFLALRQLGVSHASVLIWHGTWAEALVQALLPNIPRRGGTRKGSDAERALRILAHALGRPVRPEEAASLGIEWSAHHELAPELLRMIRLPAELEIVAATIAREARAVAVTNKPPRRPARGGKRPEVSRRS
jgi:hypothetical protein